MDRREKTLSWEGRVMEYVIAIAVLLFVSYWLLRILDLVLWWWKQ